MDPLVIAVTIVAIVLSIILLVVGVQTIMVLQQVRKTLERANQLIESAEASVNRLTSPLQNLGGMMDGLKTGFKMLEMFAHFLKQNTASKSKSNQEE